MSRRAALAERPLEPLRVQTRQTIREDGTVREERLALCPATEQWVSLNRCRVCADCAHVSGDTAPILVCTVTPRRTAGRERTIRALLAPAVWCIDAGAPASLVSAMPATQADAMVVDDDGHVIGLLPRSRAVAPGPGTARAQMDPVVVGLLDGAPIERARDLFRTHGIRTLPVLSGGRVIGCVNPEPADVQGCA